MAKVLIVDDSPTETYKLTSMLEKHGYVVSSASSGADGVAKAKVERPDLVLMDMNMPAIGGLEATKQILRFSENTRVIVLSVHKENPIPAKVMQMGAFGYLTKDSDPEEMIKAIYKVHAGQKYVSPDIAQQIALGQLNLNDKNPFDQLSERELEITLMLTKGAKVPDIAVYLNISAKTVNTYRYRMFEKLNVSTDVELTHLALRNKLISSDHL